MDLRTLAAALGGKVRGQWVHAPGPDHSRKDMSLSVRLDPDAPEGFRVHSFAGDDWMQCAEHVRKRLGLPDWQPDVDRIDLSRWMAKMHPNGHDHEEEPSTPERVVATYNYRDALGNALYRVCRTDPKGFFQERPDGRGKWVKGIGNICRVLYRWPDLIKYPDATVFICEGEKDAERLIALGYCATTVAYGAWAGSWGSVDISALTGRDIIVLEDNDPDGSKRAQTAVDTVLLVAKSVRRVLLPGLPDKGDVSDWLDADAANAERLVEVCFSYPETSATVPIDLWGASIPPALPEGLLPKIIEDFAFVQGTLMGADPAGFAMAALAICAAALPDRIKLKVKPNEPGWMESARIWVALVGNPSTRKSPIMRLAARPLIAIDKKLHQEWARKFEEYKKLSAEEKRETDAHPPEKVRVRIENTTVEAAQEILKDSHNGVLCLQDELTDWFASMERYNSGKRGADRGFWLSAYNGGSSVVDRIGRGSVFIPNLSVCLLGGIQPEPMVQILQDSADDGLIQRILPVILRPSTVGSEEEAEAPEYNDLIERLHRGCRGIIGGNTSVGELAISFSEEAQKIRREMEIKHRSLMEFEQINVKLGAFMGKLDGLFPRLCLLFHAIENSHGGVLEPIPASVAHRVAQFIHEFILPHAFAFYAQSSNAERDASAAALFILGHPELKEVTPRDLARGDHAMRRLDRRRVDEAFRVLDIMGWVDTVPGPRPSSPARWVVNPQVHVRYSDMASEEMERRQKLRTLIRKTPGVVHE